MGLGRSFIIWVFGFSCFLAFEFGAAQNNATLVADEVAALREIASRLNKSDWDFNVDPCNDWIRVSILEYQNNVTCNCFNTECHVTNIVLKGQGLPGVLPPELIKLPYLKEIDLTRNYLNGTIPRQWGSSKLEIISLIGNRLSGSIPKEIGNITTLRELVLESNGLSGTIPPELGSLINLERLLLSSNNFTGQLPETFSNLANLSDLRISDNQFSGKIPSMIQNWTSLTKLVMQASGLQGPIPSDFSGLTKLSDLRISDLNGSESVFPKLNKGIKTLILRNCNINGTLPSEITSMTTLKTLDLSFNRLTGEIPSTYDALSSVDFIYLSANLLSGPVPDRWLQRGEVIDLSYNNLTVQNSAPSCQQRKLNLFRTSSSLGNNLTGVVSCLRSSQCPEKKLYELNINCGGQELNINGTKYEADSDAAGPSNYHEVSNWAFSSTGDFMDNGNSDIYVGTSNLANDLELYKNARISPLSFTYIGYCLQDGSYNVNLHFAEIIFSNEKNYSSLGRRVFNVYIQGNLVLENFNIVDEAGGSRKPFIKKIDEVNVTSGTLEIHLYWAGKGSTAIPSRGTYGPLISAISVKPNFIPPSEGGKGISGGAVAGIVVTVLVFIFLVLVLLWWKGCLGNKTTMDQDLKGVDLQTGTFTLRQIKAATNNFDNANKIGEGGFGPVYKGILSDGTIIAVKQLSSKSKQGNREFVNEIGMISALQHPHLVRLYGCCIEGNQLLLIYEYLENNSLARALFGPEEFQLKLDWPTRHKICVGIARGLAYLHEESRLKIVHRDIKATNVLLDKDLNPKISDFGLAKLDEEENTHISTRIAGTYGYMAPEYAMRGYLTDKADVYSFGIVALEIVSGKSNTSFRPKEERIYLLDWALILKAKGCLIDLVDPRLGSEFNKDQVMAMINVALLCTNESAELRPAMSSVVSMLEGQAPIQELVSDSSISSSEVRYKDMMKYYQSLDDKSISESQTRNTLNDGPWTGSSTSANDLYPIKLDSRYLNDRE
ncbi:PREDICTED: probable leucine-rich repeat receptor-like serine/threonine-protein kinase At3g14840 [Nelumbo nucifera]|uniref:non-specific serine/threonine protein kinase n=1 Tax=Nelumbo nucifera TaxID=4432 RepID=A0A1U7Z611_NELNU|nr:PREDICTED: probable leucine-rich repeat receptor-like serine/threonine-protein kinase At3g14840 [Nelumbo nucifera]